jgi:hypothetical protein
VDAFSRTLFSCPVKYTLVDVILVLFPRLKEGRHMVWVGAGRESGGWVKRRRRCSKLAHHGVRERPTSACLTGPVVSGPRERW